MEERDGERVGACMCAAHEDSVGASHAPGDDWVHVHNRLTLPA